ELPQEPEGEERLRAMFLEPASMVRRPQAQSPAPVSLSQAAEAGLIRAPPTEDQQDAPPPPQPPAAEQPNGGAWYTEAQAMRADQQYVEHCSRCHGLALQGVGVAPSLAGGNFIERWAGSTVGDVYLIASVLMPLDGQGELEEQTYAD